MPAFQLLRAAPACGHPTCYIVPPHMLEHMARHGSTPAHRASARRALAHMHDNRARRETVRANGLRPPPAAPRDTPPLADTGTNAQDGAAVKREIYSCGGTQTPRLTLERDEGAPAQADTDANEAYDFAGATWDFYWKVLRRDSVDGKGMQLVSNVHLDAGIHNAYWDGAQMFYCDPTPGIFNRFTVALDIVAHELTHGVTQNTAALEYRGQSGAINESMSDVFGSLVKQWHLGQTVDQADWLIGAALFVQVPGRLRQGLRSLKAPGTAYNDPDIGMDLQPDHMRGYRELPEVREGDFGGVHINSGIPNKAFYLAATALDGNAWDRAGPIWYRALTQILQPASQFADLKAAAVQAAKDLYDDGVAAIVSSSFDQVGI